MKVVSVGADISNNDVSCSESLINNINQDMANLIDLGAEKAALTNVTGDDVVISAFVPNKNMKSVNQGIVDILRTNAEDIGDVAGISETPEGAGEGISYAEAKIRQDRFPDAIIVAFDTYGGEEIVADMANTAINAASGMEGVTDISDKIKNEVKKIPGVGYVSNETDDPVIAVTVEDLESIGPISGAMSGAILGNRQANLVERGTPSYIIPKGVIFSITAFLNGNVLDLAIPLQDRTRILK